MKYTLEEHKLMLQEFSGLPEIIRSESIFNVAGYPQYEK